MTVNVFQMTMTKKCLQHWMTRLSCPPLTLLVSSKQLYFLFLSLVNMPVNLTMKSGCIVTVYTIDTVLQK